MPTPATAQRQRQRIAADIAASPTPRAAATSAEILQNRAAAAPPSERSSLSMGGGFAGSPETTALETSSQTASQSRCALAHPARTVQPVAQHAADRVPPGRPGDIRHPPRSLPGPHRRAGRPPGSAPVRGERNCSPRDGRGGFRIRSIAHHLDKALRYLFLAGSKPCGAARLLVGHGQLWTTRYRAGATGAGCRRPLS